MSFDPGFFQSFVNLVAILNSLWIVTNEACPNFQIFSFQSLNQLCFLFW